MPFITRNEWMPPGNFHTGVVHQWRFIIHYYKRHLGDYAKKAGRLSMFQHGAYTLLLDACYDREQFPTLEQAIEWTWASSKDEIDAVNFILKKFFFMENGVFVQHRVQEELKNYQVVSEINTRIAIERETKRKENGTKRVRLVHEAPRSDHEAPPNHEPLTTNHKPVTKKNTEYPPPDGVDISVWQDFLKIRKAKKSLMTATTLKGIEAEASKAGITLSKALEHCCTRGWASFKASWLDGDKTAYTASITVPSRPGVDPALAKVIADGLMATAPSAEIREKMKLLSGARA